MPWSPPPLRWPCRLPRAGSPRARSRRPTLSPRTPNTRRHKGENMALSDFLNRKRPPLDGGTGEGVSPLSGDLAGNEAVRRKQRLLLAGAAGGGLILSSFWIFSGGGDSEKLGEDGVSEVTVSTKDLVNRNLSQQEWMALSENRRSEEHTSELQSLMRN